MEQIEKSNVAKTGEVFDTQDKQRLGKSEYVKQWMSQAEFDDTTSETSSLVYSSSVVESEDFVEDLGNMNLGEKPGSTASNITQNTLLAQKFNTLPQVFNTKHNVQTFGDVKIEQSSGIHIGNVTYVTGPIHITDTNGGNISSINQLGNSGIKFTSQTNPSPENNEPVKNIHISPYNISEDDVKNFSGADFYSEPEEEEREEQVRNDAFVGQIKRNIIGSVLKIVKRRTWLAQVSLEPYSYIEEPVPYVIISHTATEITRTQAETVYLVRHIQCFHIESCRWIDISYNFLIGGDGNVYEGRGWGVVGAHTYGYNERAVGISFVGCFMKELPPAESLAACKLLIKRGVELGHIDPNYKLLAHCQCCPTESPGRRLFEEIKTWPHFTEQNQVT